jgi:hypothetical protein
MQLGSNAASPRVLTLTASSVVSTNAIKTSVATVAAAVTYSGAALNGADVDGSYVARPTPSGLSNVAQYPTATASSNAGSYVNGSHVMFTGTYGDGYGSNVTRTATVSGTGGNATFIADGPLDTLTSITVDAQTNTGGAWVFGWNDIACPRRGGCLEPYRTIRPTSAGNCLVTCASGDDALLPLTLGGSDEIVNVNRIKFSDATTTITTVNVYE